LLHRNMWNDSEESQCVFMDHNYASNLEAKDKSMQDHTYISSAHDLAERNGYPFSSEKKLAGANWARGFLSCYPELSLRKPEATSMTCLTGFNKIQVGKFFLPPEKRDEQTQGDLETLMKPIFLQCRYQAKC